MEKDTDVFFLRDRSKISSHNVPGFSQELSILESALHCGKAFNFLLVTSHNLKDFGISPLESGKGTFRICAIKTYISTYSPFERNFFKNSLLHRYYGYVAQCDFQFKK